MNTGGNRNILIVLTEYTLNLNEFLSFGIKYNHTDAKSIKCTGGINMRIILDTDKKTITVPWNYSDKLEAMNKIIVEATGDDKAKKTFSGYIDEIWKYAMENSDTQLKTAQKPSRSRKDREQGE